jgi:hypothetical protein
MEQRLIRMIRLTALVQAVLLSPVTYAQPQKADTPYPTRAPLEQYLMSDRDSEIALARSAAPTAISHNAEIMVLDRQGYKTAIRGSNGFACIVQRSWIAPFEDPEFWNPKTRSPMCLNEPGARSYLPIIIARTNLALAGKSNAEIAAAMKDAFDNKKLPPLESGAMGYMMSKAGHLGDRVGHWHPHLMLFLPLTSAKSWGAGLSGSPIFAFEDPPERLTVFLVPVVKWSDGTADSHDTN